MNRTQFIKVTPALLAFAAGITPTLGCTRQTQTTDETASDLANMIIDPPVVGRSSGEYDIISSSIDFPINNDQCRLLQITDLHFFNKNAAAEFLNETDINTISDLNNYVELFNPDIIVVTGDLWHDNPENNGRRMLETAIGEIEKLGRPFTFTWGNHDLLDDFQYGHDFIKTRKNSLYVGDRTHGDHRIRLVDEAGELRSTIFCMNSNQFGLTRWQLDWLNQSAQEMADSDTSALAFFHIPLLEQKTLYNANLIPGIQGEEVCNEKENGESIGTISKSGIIATFCGHDHVNDYTVSANGVDLVYGRATGYSGYGGDTVKKGAKIIDWDLINNTYTAKTVFADGSVWDI